MVRIKKNIVFSPFCISETEILVLSQTGILGDLNIFFRKKSACYEFIPPQNLMFLYGNPGFKLWFLPPGGPLIAQPATPRA